MIFPGQMYDFLKSMYHALTYHENLNTVWW